MDSFYSEKSRFETSQHESALSMSRSIRSMNQHELGDRTNCISPVGEMDGKSRNQRRRVPVACGRCRRRKIKCSGDSGDGQGCSNCRSAGNTDCQFLRVNSSAVIPKGTGWPYPNGGAITASPRLRMYSPHASGKSTLLSMGSPQTRMSGFQRTEFDLSSDTQAFSRPVGLDSIHFETEQGGNHSQSPAYILPNAPSGMVDYEASASSWSPKIWEPVLNVNRSNNGGTNIYPEPDTNGSMNQAPYSYMLPSQGMTSNEIPQTTATTMNMVSVSDIPCSDRILPTPTSRSQQISNNTSASASASAMNLFADGVPGLSVPSDFKTSYWNQNQNQRCMDQHQHQHQRTHTVPSNAPFPSPTQSSKYTNANNDTNTNTNTAPELIFPYIPLTNPTETSPPLSSAPSSTTSNSSCSYTLDPHPLDTQDYGTDPQSQSHHRPSTSKRLMTLSNDCSDIYSYTSSEKKTRPEDPCSATLMSGLSYTRVRHSDNPPLPPPPPPTANMFSCGLIPEHLQEYHHRGVVGNMHHRSTISSLGNQGAY